MSRVLAWAGVSLALWAAYVWLATRPRFWAGLALASERVSLGAREAYNLTKLAQQDRARAWEEFNQQHRARGRAGDTITDIQEFLRRERSP